MAYRGNDELAYTNTLGLSSSHSKSTKEKMNLNETDCLSKSIPILSSFGIPFSSVVQMLRRQYGDTNDHHVHIFLILSKPIRTIEYHCEVCPEHKLIAELRWDDFVGQC